MSEWRITKLAAQDLQDIWDYIGRDSPGAAGNWIRTLISKFDLVAQLPGVGARRDDLMPAIRMYPVKSYLILYKSAEGDAVEIVRVIHGSRDLRQLFQPDGPSS